MKEFFEENKKIVIIFGCVIVGIILFLTINSIFFKNDVEQNTEQTIQTNNITAIKKYEEDNIYLKDFFNGTNGWHTDIINKYNDSYTIIYENNASISYTSSLTLGQTREYKTFPTYSEYIVLLKRKSGDAFLPNNADREINIDDNSRILIFKTPELGGKYIDENYEIYSDGSSDTYKTQIKEDLDSGYGIETTTLKECIDVEAFKEESHIDLNEDIWKNINYNARYKSLKQNNVDLGDDNNNIKTVYNKVFKGKDFCYLTYVTEKYEKSETGYVSYWKVNDCTQDPTLYLGLEGYGYQSVEQALEQKYYVSDQDIKELSKK